MKRFIAFLAISTGLLLSSPAHAQIATQEFCDLMEKDGDLVALNSGWCHSESRPFVASLYPEADLIVVANHYDGDPVGTSRIAIVLLSEEGGEIVVAVLVNEDWQALEYLEGNADIARNYDPYLVDGLTELSRWRAL